MSSRRQKDVRVYYRNGSWWETVSAAEVLLIRHLHEDHGLSIRQINRKTGMTDRMVQACLESD